MYLKNNILTINEKLKKQIDITQILMITGDVNYATITFQNQKKILLPFTLKRFEDILPKSLFVRTHRKNLFNRTLIQVDESFNILINNTPIAKFSRRRIENW